MALPNGWNEFFGGIGGANSALIDIYENLRQIMPEELPDIEGTPLATMEQIMNRLDAIEGAVAAMTREIHLQSIRTINCHLSPDSPLRYPAGTPQVALDALPHLKRDAMRINDADAAAALGLLGQPVPNADIPADVKIRQFQEFIGVYD